MKRHQLARRPPDEWARPKPQYGTGGFSEKEMRARHKAVMDERVMAVSCALCDWAEPSLPFAAAVVAAKEHREAAHPELAPYAKSKRRRERERAMELARRRGSDAMKDRAA